MDLRPCGPPGEYTRAVRYLAAAGVQTCTHAIGDAGVRHVIDTLDGAGTGGVRLRVEHLETIPDDLVKRLAAAPIRLTMVDGAVTHRAG